MCNWSQDQCEKLKSWQSVSWAYLCYCCHITFIGNFIVMIQKEGLRTPRLVIQTWKIMFKYGGWKVPSREVPGIRSPFNFQIPHLFQRILRGIVGHRRRIWFHHHRWGICWGGDGQPPYRDFKLERSSPRGWRRWDDFHWYTSDCAESSIDQDRLAIQDRSSKRRMFGFHQQPVRNFIIYVQKGYTLLIDLMIS